MYLEKINKNLCYKINLPSDYEISFVIKDVLDLSDFNLISEISDSFSFDSDIFRNYILSEYVQINKLDKELISFYSEDQKNKIGEISIKKRITLYFILSIKKYDCVLFSLEALSIKTKEYLIQFAQLLIDKYLNKTILLFDFSTDKDVFDEIEITQLGKE